MENASKALMIAAGVLLGLLLLSVMIYLFTAGASVNKAYDNNQISYQLELYNSKFEFFDRNNNNIIDIISIANLAYDVNLESNFDPSISVKLDVKIDGVTYSIPNSYCYKCKNSNNINLKDNKCNACSTTLFTERNKIVKSDSNVISIYDLANKNMGTITGQNMAGNADDTLSLTKLVNGKTIYKYLFCVEQPTDFTYHEHNGRVAYVKLTAYQNPDW